MFKGIGKSMGFSSKKGKSKSLEADGSSDIGGSNSTSPGGGGGGLEDTSLTGGNNLGRAKSKESILSNSESGVGGGGRNRSGSNPSANGGGGGVQGLKAASHDGQSSSAGSAKIEKKGGVSRHESPLPSPSSSSRNVLQDGSVSVDGNGNGYGGDEISSSPMSSRSSTADRMNVPSPLGRPGSSGGNSDFGNSSIGGSSASAAAIAAANSAPPGIPTTQTILANPVGQASSSSNNSNSRSPIPPSSLVGSSTGKEDPSVRTFDIDDMISRLLEAGYATKLPKPALKNAEIVAVCQAAREVLLSQPTLIELSPPVKIVGDTHGQYQDLLRLFEMCGFPPQSNYLFLGDYVDRGKQSLETILLLLCYKVKYPENFFLLRGNHECANVTRGELLVLSGKGREEDK